MTTHLPAKPWHTPRLQAHTYSALSCGLSSMGHHTWTTSSMGVEQFLQSEDSNGGSGDVKNA